MNNANAPISYFKERTGRNSFNDETFYEHKGLTKREYFAGLAMQGMLAYDSSGTVQPLILAANSVMFADALLKALGE